jgi:hypothetical protein
VPGAAVAQEHLVVVHLFCNVSLVLVGVGREGGVVRREKLDGVIPLVHTFGHEAPQLESVHAPR